MDDLKNNKALLLYYVRLCASFQTHRWIQTGIIVRKHSIRVNIGDILSHVTLEFDGWHWKTIGHLLCTTSRFVHHFKSIGEVKLELQSGNAQFESKLAIFCPAWTWNLMDNLENNRAPLIHYIKLCASFQSHGWIQTGVTVRKRWIRVEIGNFVCHVTLILDIWHWKTKGHPSYAASSFVHHSIAIGEFKLELQPGNTQIGSNSTIFFSRVTSGLDFCIDATSINGNISRKFQDDTMRGTLSKRCDRRTDGQTDRRKEVLLELLGRS